ncbi:MAG TPA: serine hydrolase domain-containing protein, partial [Gemmatimonadaceae bacterium]
MMLLRRSLWLVALVATHPLAAQRTALPPGWDAFTQLFDRYSARDSIVGGSLVVMRDGNVVARHEYGYADRAGKKRIDDNTIFHYGSITKTLTAISIMQLRDRGKLSLDDRVTSYIPELRQVHDPYGSMDSVTIRMLMSHSAGFQNPTWPYKQGKSWEPFEPTTWNQLVAMMPYQELLFKPGAR